jgi:hypothetical protein
MDGQAENASGSLDDLASFLDGEPNGAIEEEQADDQPEEGVGNEDDAPAESDESDDDEESEAETEEEKPEEPASERKYKVTVKGEDGADVTEEVTEQELLSGYQRQKAFTQKTMELAEQSREAAKIVEKTISDGRNYYLQQAQAAKNAILQVAGLKSEQELAQLAHSDPAAWVQERQRIQAVGGYLSQLDQQIQQEQQQTAQQATQRYQETVSKAWTVLTEKGIDKPQLASMYESAQKLYGYKPEEIHANVDPRSVLMLKDALAYRELQAKKPQIAQKVNSVAKLPAQKKSLPTNERKTQELNARFSKGRAKVNDLATFLANNKF